MHSRTSSTSAERSGRSAKRRWCCTSSRFAPALPTTVSRPASAPGRRRPRPEAGRGVPTGPVPAGSLRRAGAGRCWPGEADTDTLFLRSGRGRLRSRRSPPAPAPSTTTFSISRTRFTASLDRGLGDDHLAAVRAQDRLHFARLATAMPSAIVGPPILGRRRRAPSPSTGRTRSARRRARPRRAPRRHARDQAAAADRDDDDVEVRLVLESSSATVPCPATTSGSSYGWTNVSPPASSALAPSPARGPRRAARRPRRGDACAAPSRTAIAGMTIVAGMPRSAACRATACPWLPADTATTPLARSSA